MNGRPILLTARPACWFDHPTMRGVPHSAAISAMPFGMAWAYAPPGNWQFYGATEAPALWETLTTGEQLVVGWGITELDLPLVRTAAQATNAPAHTLDLLRVVTETTGRHYTLQTIAMYNFERYLTASNAQVAHLIANGQIDEASQHCRRHVEIVAALYLHLLEGRPLMLLARRDRRERDDLRLILRRDGTYAVERER